MDVTAGKYYNIYIKTGTYPTSGNKVKTVSVKIKNTSSSTSANGTSNFGQSTNSGASKWPAGWIWPERASNIGPASITGTETGILSVDKYLTSINVEITSIKEKLNYFGSHETSYIYTVFDQIFYGAKLYEQIYTKPATIETNGLIEKDKVLINSEIVSALQRKFRKKIATVTGRGKFAFSYSLKDFLDSFDISNSIFLEDESKELAKPNVEPVNKVANKKTHAFCMSQN